MRLTVNTNSNLFIIKKLVSNSTKSYIFISILRILGVTVSKTKRRPVLRINSRLSTKTTRSLSQPTYQIENDCHLCCENPARYEYDPCRHCAMCGECSVKLTSEQHEQCIICRRHAKIAEINLRVSMKFF